MGAVDIPSLSLPVAESLLLPMRKFSSSCAICALLLPATNVTYFRRGNRLS